VKRALITGASGMLGAALARRLAAQGLHVYLHAHTRADQARRTAEEIIATGGSAEVLVFDVVNGEQTGAALAAALERGPIQVVINNAGVHDDAVLPGMRTEQWRRVIDVSLNGFYNVTQPLLMPMIATRWGRVISISSVSALVGNRGQVNYAAAKAGLHGATRTLAVEVASRGITVNAIAPGVIAAGMTARAFDTARIEALVPMKRAGTPEEVAALAGFLASEEAGYISGQIISINGGMI